MKQFLSDTLAGLSRNFHETSSNDANRSTNLGKLQVFPADSLLPRRLRACRTGDYMTHEKHGT